MGEIVILDDCPAILTKDGSWHPKTPMIAGAIFVLPTDAVLVMPPILAVADPPKKGAK